jgi:hypothetical protein
MMGWQSMSLLALVLVACQASAYEKLKEWPNALNRAQTAPGRPGPALGRHPRPSPQRLYRSATDPERAERSRPGWLRLPRRREEMGPA